MPTCEIDFIFPSYAKFSNIYPFFFIFFPPDCPATSIPFFFSEDLKLWLVPPAENYLNIKVSKPSCERGHLTRQQHNLMLNVLYIT